MKKTIFTALILAFLSLFSLAFGYNAELIKMSDYSVLDWSKAYKKEVIIERPLEDVWEYASDSSKAREWSVYFHHIKPLPGPIEDGKVGSTRRCFRNENEKGAFWDEEVLDVQPLKSRLILSYNFGGYYWKSPTFVTYVLQQYEKIDDNTTRMSFSTIATPTMNYVDRLIFFFSQFQVREVFQKNLENIKRRIEGKEQLYPYTRSSYVFFERS